MLKRSTATVWTSRSFTKVFFRSSNSSKMSGNLFHTMCDLHLDLLSISHLHQGGLEMLNSCCFTKVYLSILYSDQLKYLHCLGFRRAAMLGGKGGIREIWRINWPSIAQVDKSRAGTLLDIIWQITLAATAALLSGLCVFNSWTTVWEDVAQLSGTRNSYLTPEQAIWHQKQLSGTRNSYLASETAIWHQKQISGTRNS